MSDLDKIHKEVQKELKKARERRLNQNESTHSNQEYLKMVKELKEKYPDKNQEKINQSNKEEYHESPYTMEDGTATFLYIVTMVIGTLFVDRWFIYIAATFIYIMFRTRHKRKK